jgi:ribosomal protein L3
MATKSRPRFGSLQFWPRKRTRKFLPSVNWDVIKGENLLGFIGYKVGMISCMVKDNTPDSRSKGQKISIPATVVETPGMRILSVRFYKFGKVAKEILNDNLDRGLKKVLKIPKESKKPNLDEIKIMMI